MDDETTGIVILVLVCALVFTVCRAVAALVWIVITDEETPLFDVPGTVVGTAFIAGAIELKA